MNQIKIEEALNKENFIITEFKGTSMLPLLDEKQDLVKLVQVKDKLNIDDIALFKREDKLVLHRVMEVKKNYYLICGDNQTVLEKVKYDQVIGKVEGYYKKGKYISLNDEEYINYLNNLEKDLTKRKHYFKINRLNQEYIDTINLIKAVIHNKKYNKISDYNKVFNVCKNQKICAFVFKSIDKKKCPKDIYDKWTQEYNNALQRKLLFDAERKQILQLFEDNKISYLPLKGIIINELYPKDNYREFSDNDILVDDIKLVNKLMLQREYKLTKGEVHYCYYKGILNFEMHTRLFTKEYNFNYFDNYLDKAIKDKKNNYSYHMSNEDLYAHVLAHLYKHHSGYGAGIRYYIDLYYIKNSLKISSTKLNKILKVLNLFDFNNECLKLIDIMFDSNLELPIEDVNYIFSGSTYGIYQNMVDKNMDKYGKFGFIRYRALPPYSFMCRSFPILEKLPILLPIFYIYRGLQIVFSKKRRNILKAEAKAFKKHVE